MTPSEIAIWISIIRDLIDAVDLARRLHVVRPADSHRIQRLRIEDTITRANALLRQVTNLPSVGHAKAGPS